MEDAEASILSVKFDDIVAFGDEEDPAVIPALIYGEIPTHYRLQLPT